jgi:hypothetical protein
MKFFTFLLLASVGLIVFAVLNEYGVGARPSGSAGPNQTTSGAPAPSAGSFTTKSIIAPSFSSVTPAPPGIFSTALAFFRRGFTATGGKHTGWQRSELRIARGIVVDQLDGGLVMNCGGWVIKSATRPDVYAGDGRGMNALYANLVDAREQFQFGRLMIVDHGTARQSVYDPAMWTPESYLYGTVLLNGYPLGSLGPGKGFKVVVAPDGHASWQGNLIPAYTASFTLAN